MSTQAGQPLTNGPKGPQTFEFTKRKRWADLLVAELADVILFVLSPSREILYCGNAVTELLGWRVVDLLDRDLLDLISSPSDQLTLCAAFHQSTSTNVELLSYLRFKSNSPLMDGFSDFKDILFELKGYPHFVHNECKCLFVMARPYPSRNTSMLNTFLELKMENERLQQRLTELHSLLPLQSKAPSSLSNAIYTASAASRLLPCTRFLDPPASYYTVSSITANGEDLLRSSGDHGDGMYYGVNSLYAPSDHLDEDTEEGLKKKKPRKSHPSEQYVCITCGRTDSPEWRKVRSTTLLDGFKRLNALAFARKGPLGPKTLCNACGLRWAKQMRKYDEPTEGTDLSEVPASS